MLPNNSKGFVLVDAMLAFSLFIILLTFLLPIGIQLKKEQVVLSVRSQMLSELHDALSATANNSDLLLVNTISHQNTDATIEMELVGNQWKGCIQWINVKSKEERKCLYVTKIERE
jgi:competence protein ComGE